MHRCHLCHDISSLNQDLNVERKKGFCFAHHKLGNRISHPVVEMTLLEHGDGKNITFVQDSGEEY